MAARRTGDIATRASRGGAHRRAGPEALAGGGRFAAGHHQERSQMARDPRASDECSDASVAVVAHATAVAARSRGETLPTLLPERRGRDHPRPARACRPHRLPLCRDWQRDEWWQLSAAGVRMRLERADDRDRTAKDRQSAPKLPPQPGRCRRRGGGLASERQRHSARAWLHRRDRSPLARHR